MKAGTIRPADAQARSRNELRPLTWDDVVGQDTAKSLMQAAARSAWDHRRPLEHTLLVAASGTGKTTFSHVIAETLGVDIYELEAPVSREALLDLREQMQDGDILKIEEIHQQAIMERRGKTASVTPEGLYSIMEDRMMQTQQGPLSFPRITIIGTTTDEGMLPDAFVNRFPLRPRLKPYTWEDMQLIVRRNCARLGLRKTVIAIETFALASRGVPREANNLVKNALILTPKGGLCDRDMARWVLEVNGLTRDGLTPDMQAMLTFLLTKARRVTADDEVVYQASVGSIATAIGKSRDAKAISLRVEPYLIERGFVQVTHGGRRLTERGINRTERLLEGIHV